jgi:hypothetical protein
LVLVWRVKLAVGLGLVAHARHQVRDGHAGVGDLKLVRVIEDRHQRDQPPVAPAQDSDALWIHVIQRLQRPISRRDDVGHLQAPVVDRLVVRAAVAGRPAILRGDDDVALLHQLTDHVCVVGVEVAVDPAVRQHQEWMSARRRRPARHEDVGVHLERVPLVGDPVRLLVPGIGHGRDVDLVHFGEVADALEPQQVVNLLGHRVDGVGQLLELLFELRDARRQLVGGSRFRRLGERHRSRGECEGHGEAPGRDATA